MPRKHYCLMLATLLASATLLPGCTSLMRGKQYAFPQQNEPSATVQLQDDPYTELHIMTFSDNGCYAGFTPVPSSGGVMQAPVAVGKPLVLTYRRSVGSSFCQVPFSFIPEAGASYALVPGFRSEAKAGILPMFNTTQDYCGVGVVRKVGTEQSVVAIQPLRIKTGFACLKFVNR
ncbi:hypothetical protein [Pseudomonas sp. TE3610]